jgi:DNA-binding winged helix-turn-helix (wHTH) protein
MLLQTSEKLEFGPFVFEEGEGTLRRDGMPIHLTPTEARLLRRLAENYGKIVPKDDLMKDVWEGTNVEEGTLHRTITSVRNKLGGNRERYIQTIHRRGYRLQADEETEKIVSTEPPPPPPRRRKHLYMGLFAAGAVILIVFAVVAGRNRGSNSGPFRTAAPRAIEESTIRGVLRDSQTFESLNVYVNPERFRRQELARYFVMPEFGGKAAQNIEAAVARQLQRGLHYGSDSKLLSFEVLNVRIPAPGDYAEVRTRERWYLPSYRSDGTRAPEKSPYFGPYEIDYTLRKLDGKWLVQFASNPYAR